MQTREELVFAAQFNENTELYQDMSKVMKQLIGLGEELNDKERNLFSIASKNLIATNRSAWRVVSTIETREKNRTKLKQERLDYISEYRQKIEAELREACLDVIKTLDDELIPRCTDVTAKVFYHKMRADYFRYITEFTVDDDRKANAEKALESYQMASNIATELEVADPSRLGLALNFSVFYYEIMTDRKQAIELADAASSAAREIIDNLSEEKQKDASLILSLIDENLQLWKDEEAKVAEAKP